MGSIIIRGARTHNLKNIDITLPRDKLIVFTGLSGSGKSSLAFDTIFAEGQRRYVESLSTYARQFLSVMEKPDLDHIEGLSPAISIEQKTTSHNPRSTVGTITEIYDYLRLLFARVGTPRCPRHHITLEASTISQMVDQVLALPENSRLMLLAPVVMNRKGEHVQLFDNLRRQGFLRARINGEIYELDDPPKLELRKKHDIEVIVDRFKVRSDLKLRLAESFETALHLTDGIVTIASLDAAEEFEDLRLSANFACPECGYSIAELEPRLFSFNSPAGACPACDGLGTMQFFDPKLVVKSPELSMAGGAIRGWDRRNGYYFQMLQSLARHFKFDIEIPFRQLQPHIQDIILNGSPQEVKFSYQNERGDRRIQQHPFEGILPNLKRRYRDTESSMVREELAKFLSNQPCETCSGERLNEAARHVTVNNHSLAAITRMPIEEALEFFLALELPGKKGEIAEKINKEVRERLSFLVNVGLEYLSLGRSAETLSGGESQRIRLASQIGAGLVGVMYILDEPSIGLHQRDNDRLLNTLRFLRDLGNTVIVVEHDEDAISAADLIVDIGPGAGVHGGEIIATGNLADITGNPNSITGQYLNGTRSIAIPSKRSKRNRDKLICINQARSNNLKSVDLELPIGLFTCITGVSGSGKSTLINETLYKLAAIEINASNLTAGQCESFSGFEHFDKVIDINQSPIGRTPRSNPATYTGLFTPIREIYSGTQESRSRGYKPGRFSFNVKGGRCEACQGDGVTKVEMHFLPDVYVTCDICKGKRYNRETLDILFKGKNIHQVLEMTVEDATAFFSAIPVLKRKLDTLMDVGLSYITLGQNATTLSGGEAQRIKLARELSKRDTGSTLYILDEPTTGLHFHDIEQLLSVLHRLRDHGNTIVVIEHNMHVIKTADWIIDLGPEGGDKGGEIIASGTPEQVAKVARSYTGHYLKAMLESQKQTVEPEPVSA
ncbi:MAG: excinuclease ABC subunit UvrA [Gammaproteobacteria bacterium]|nr:excinuclease ABC subunit UvrA [Gammaproteobacteria bacterium]